MVDKQIKRYEDYPGIIDKELAMNLPKVYKRLLLISG